MDETKPLPDAESAHPEAANTETPAHESTPTPETQSEVTAEPVDDAEADTDSDADTGAATADESVETVDNGEEAAIAAQEAKAKAKAKKKKKAKKAKEKATKAEVAKPKAKTFGTSRGIETMFRTSYRAHINISAIADNKANIMISINAIIMSIILSTVAPNIDMESPVVIPVLVFLVFCLISIIYAILCARPRISTDFIPLEKIRAENRNILFFGNFVKMPEDAFLEDMEELMQDTDQLYRNMIRDIYGLGLVLQRKFALLRWSYNSFLIGLVASVASFFVALIMTWVG